VSRLSFRQRVALLTALAIAATVAAASATVWVIAKRELYGQVNSTLDGQVYAALHGQGLFGGGSLTELVRPDGSTTGAIPVTPRMLLVAQGKGDLYYASTSVQTRTGQIPIRQVVVPLASGGALVAIQPLDPTLHALSRIRFWILLIGGLGVLVAAALAAGVATLALRPVRRLTAAAETVAATGDLSERVEVGSTDDELGRLAARFNSMLAALEESVGRQRRLVADASHELRTPLTAARANVDLVREGKLPPEEEKHALDEAAVELDSLTTLVSDLVELSRGEERKLRVEEVQLDDLVASAVEREKSRAPERTFITSLSPTLVRVDAVLVERAVLNLLDNAVKYSPPGAPIEVSVRDGEVVVEDHGPGIAEEDLPRVFDRFYRAAGARAKPGSGLGLAIVREAAEAHGGRASVESSAGGARFRLSLPATA
jgi:two-component system, OmpR family, sensor histidine kinase MprB